jgi:hypothetical protein
MSTFIFLSIAGGAGTNIPVVANYDALIAAYPPPNTTYLGQFVFVENAQGTWWIPGPVFGTYYPAGLYYCNGTTWKTADVPYQATQAEVDAGTVTDKFVSPETFNNSAQLASKLTATVTSPVEGDVIRYNATTAIWENSQSFLIRESDFVNPYHYSGTAQFNTLISSPTWIIKRIDFSTFGSPITETATGAWTNRYSLVYS